MDYIQLQYFCLAAKLSHITKAAEELHVTQPTVTAAIQKLEKELNVKLFQKNGRNIELTDYGKAFYLHAQKALKEIDQGISDVNSLIKTNKKQVKLVIPSLKSAPGLFEILVNEFPDIIISDLDDDPTTIRAAVLDKSFDLVISMCPIEDANIESQVLRYEKFCVLSTKDGIFSNRTSVTPKDLQNVWMASLKIKNSGPRYILELISQTNSSEHVRYEGKSLHDLLSAVKSKKFVAIVTERSASNFIRDDESLRIIELRNTLNILPRTLYYLSEKSLSPEVKRAREIILDYYKQHQ